MAIEPTLNFLQDPRPGNRKQAADALAKTFQANVRLFALVTNTLAKDKEISDRWRSFADVADSRHLANRVEPEVVEALVAAVRAAYPRLSHRYYALKAKWFGKKRLPQWDRNAPLPKVATRTIGWSEAEETVLTAYGAFSPEMAAIAERFFRNNWIDAPVRPGKAPGAFAHPTVPSAHPYVLLNYQGKPRDVMTLAHELGHGVHQVLAAPNGPLMAPTPLTLAETASVFGEMLTFRKLLADTKDKEISDRWRGFKDIADARHLSNRVEREVVDALVESVRAAYPKLSHRYYALKAKWFGKKTLAHWDRNAPLPKVTQRTIPWSDARATILTAYGAFSPKMAEVADQFFVKNWIDAPVRPGKQPGAFAHPTVPSAHPYVLLNYQGKPRDVMTLAHELGHGVHQVLAAPNGPLMAPTPLTLAETASVFGEMLTFRKLLAATTDAKQRKAMLAAKVEDMINTVVRQIAFYTFERKVHTERRNGELTADKICELWMSVQSESLGPAIELKEGYEAFWTYIPHFIHSPFYVYAYAFGDCLVNSLYAVYEKSASGFAERYLEMLSAGGTKHHSELLAPFGLDARDPKFWDGGLSVIAGLITELETLDKQA
ncbi:MAG TPA: M3 family metallopeptidase [Pseudolabrys sp.]|nr:M3 family metallopeptidase [Pseudolabrys sp.]